MASYIREDLKSRIRSRGDLPAKLTLADLSRHYGVSFTPVRAAVRDLVRDRTLRKGSNGRLEIRPAAARAASSRRPPAPERPGGAERRLMTAALRHSLKGEEVYLREELTAAEYGMGRTVVRQVFARLVGTGLLEHVPRRGWRVRPLRDEELDAYLDVRETLELKALDLSRPRLVRADLARMAGRHESRLDNDLHRYLM